MTKREIQGYVKKTLRGTIPALAETEFTDVDDTNKVWVNDGYVTLSDEEKEYMIAYARQCCNRAADAV